MPFGVHVQISMSFGLSRSPPLYPLACAVNQLPFSVCMGNINRWDFHLRPFRLAIYPALARWGSNRIIGLDSHHSLHILNFYAPPQAYNTALLLSNSADF